MNNLFNGRLFGDNNETDKEKNALSEALSATIKNDTVQNTPYVPSQIQIPQRQGGLFGNLFGSPTLTGGISTDAEPDKNGKMASDLIGLGQTGAGIYGGLNGGSVGYGSLIGGGVNAASSAINGGTWNEDVPQAFFGIDDENDSEIMQGVKGAANGAMMGTAIMPVWGTLIGAALGLGASFLDDI